jgi:Fe-S cluster assembly scaffold protein SufB
MLKENLLENQSQTVFIDQIDDCNLEIPANSEVTIIAFLTKGWENKKTLTFNFRHSGSSLNFIALVVGKDTSDFQFETISNHFATATKANYQISSVLFDQSKINYRGNLVIPKTGQGAEVYLAHNTLLLSEKAKANTEPCLEIQANEVSAGHAATIGTVDDDMLFYLKSRGLNQEEGKKLLVQGFLENPLHLLDSEELKLKIKELITENLS